jgi:hypothetical protein
MAHELMTPKSLIQRIRSEKKKVCDDLNAGTGYAGPDVDAKGTAEKVARAQALTDVLSWIEEAEIEAAENAVKDALIF